MSNTFCVMLCSSYHSIILYNFWMLEGHLSSKVLEMSDKDKRENHNKLKFLSPNTSCLHLLIILCEAFKRHKIMISRLTINKWKHS